MSQKQRTPVQITTQYSNFIVPEESFQNLRQFLQHQTIIQHQDSWIDEYLSPEALSENLREQFEVSQVRPTRQIDFTLSKEIDPTLLSSSTSPIIKSRYKSIFHNFQKHLKTLLQKIIVVKKNHLPCLPLDCRAYDLWKILKWSPNASKKILQVTFGVEQRQNQATLTKMAQKNPDIKKLITHFSFSQIQKAQSLLRQIAIQQLELMSKQEIKSYCKMSKFQDFYLYLKSFIEELRNGGISRRMTKVSKIRLTKNSISSIQMER